MPDSLADLQARVVEFRDRRDWLQFHNPKDLAVSVCLEAAELLENFQWKSRQEVEQLEQDPQFRAKVIDEVADTAIYLLSLCDVMKIDLGQAIADKLVRNDQRYPVDKVRGSAKKPHEG
jgi:NTP pyrophosphatase (non-canonical NTP hydrolase)